MTESSSKKASTRVSRILKADRKAVYQAFLDPDSVASWLAPNNMKGQVRAFDAREGGTLRMSLTYLDRSTPWVAKLPNTQTRSQLDLSNWSPTRRLWKSLNSSRKIRLFVAR
jgi:Activator of Hsp90 ATPase homolog 1-like protein